MAQPVRTEKQHEKDLETISKLYLAGKTQAYIASKLKVTQQQISYDLKILQERWLASSLVNIDARKAQELAKIDNLELTYWDAWERSIGQSKRVTKKTAPVATEEQEGETENRLIEETVVTEKLVGDPRFLVGVESCIDKRCKLFGLIAPVKIAPTDPTGTKEYVGITYQERIDRLATLLDTARIRGTGQAISGDTPFPSASRDTEPVL